ncbi:MAG: heparinase II/III family protein [Colwellia sp.]|nr:heparinase II/III family protein [Colwellia sp.]
MLKILFFILSLIITEVCFASTADKLLSQLDYNQPELEKVHRFYLNQQPDEAIMQLLEYYRDKENLYLKLTSQDSQQLKDEFAFDAENSLRIADHIIAKSFLFDHKWDMERTHIPHKFNKEIDWNINPLGDVEWTYMLNRHRYWQELGRAYLLSGDEKYALAFVEHASNWIDNNPFEKRVTLESWRRLEAGMRGEYWIKAFEYFKQSPKITPKFFEKFLNSLITHAEYITSDFSNFSKTSNWGVIEFHGLFNMSLFMKEFKPASQWQSRALVALETTLKLQILDDGSHWEQSPMYHNAVLINYMNVMLLAKRNVIPLPLIFTTKTSAMLMANIKWQKPNFHQPTFGDSDDTNTQDILAFGAVLFDDSEMKSRASIKLGYDELFTLGRKQAQHFDKIQVKQPAFLSSFLASSGDVYMRSSWDEDAAYIGLHLRKLGCGHGHDDLLHFDLYANKRDYLVDSGRYNYVDDEWREFFKGNKSHNTLGVDDLPNSVYKNTWENSFEARSQGIFTKLTTDFDYAQAENTAYQRLVDPVLLKRRMLFLKPNVWVVFDSFNANGKHKYSQFFNFPNKKVTITQDRLTTTYDKDNLTIIPVNNANITLNKSWGSTDYNLKHQTLTAEISRLNTGFTSFISLLYFPDKTELQYEKLPVFSRKGKLLSELDVEAIKLVINQQEYIITVVHNSPAPAENFFVVQGQMIRGEVVLLEKTADTYISTIIKE